MSLLELPRSSITFDVSPSSSLTVRCSYVNARLPITEEVPSLVVRVDQHYISTIESYGNSITVGSTVHVWLDRWADGSNQKNLFNGLVTRLGKDTEGHIPRWYEIEATGFADHLNRFYVGYTSTTSCVSSIVSYIVQPAITAGLLTIGSIDSTTKGTYTFDHENDALSSFEALGDVCNDKKWEWFVDIDRKFYAHPVGGRTTPITFADNILSAEYEEDGRNIINAQRVFGPDGRQLGDDYEWTEDLTGWTSGADTITLQAATEPRYITYFAIKVAGESTGPSYVPPAGLLPGGSFSVLFDWDSPPTDNLWVRKTFDDPLDLSYFGRLNFDMQYLYVSVMTEEVLNESKIFKFRVRYETDSSNYYEYQYESSDVEVRKTSYFGAVEIDTDWKACELPFNLKAGRYDYVKTGNPTWDSIASIYIEILQPYAVTGNVGLQAPPTKLWIDNMWINGGFFYAFRYDSDSISEYGERRGKLIYDTSFASTDECEQIADAIIQYYAYPIKRFKTLRLNDIPATVPLGYISTITVLETVQPAAIRAVEYLLEDYRLNVNLTLSDVYVPALDQIISDLKRYVEEDEADALPDELAPAVVSNLLNAPLGHDDVDLAHNQDNLIHNPRFEIDTNADFIPDSWYPLGRNFPVGSDFKIPYRSEDETYSGQWSGIVSAENIAGATWWSRTLASEIFPIDAYTDHYVSVWAKGWHDASHTGTFSIKMEYYGDGPTYTILGENYITQNSYVTSWTNYTESLVKSAFPAGVKWARLFLIGEAGSASFFDDCLVQRYVGVDGGEHGYLDANEYQTSSESEQLVCSTTFSAAVMTQKYIATGIRAMLRVDTDDGGNHSYYTAITKYNGTPKNTFIVGTNSMTYTRLQIPNTIDVGDYNATLIVDFYLNCTNSAHTAYMKNPEILITSYSIKTPMKSRYGLVKE